MSISKPNICIIGVGGVGKAHALSAAKFLTNECDGGSITLVDNKNESLKPFLAPIWENSWGPIRDVVDINDSNIKLFLRKNSTSRVFLPAADLFIIATPNSTHVQYLNLLKNKNVICEKPIVGAGEKLPELWNLVHYGIEWVYHPTIMGWKNNRIKKIQFVHGWAPPAATPENKWQIYDLGSHVVAIVDLVNGISDSSVHDVKTYKQITEWKCDGVHYVVGYDKYVKTDTIIINDSIEIAWVPFEEQDLFYRQIQWALSGHPPVFNEADIMIQTSILERVQNYE